MPHLWLVAGPNGAGKTTLTRTEPFRTLLAEGRDGQAVIHHQRAIAQVTRELKTLT